MDAARVRNDSGLPLDLRDALTRRRLEDVATDLLHAVDVVQFDADWWDGQAHTPCLVVRGGRHLLRVVETGGEAVVIPFDRRTAQRWIADLRRPHRPELGIPAPRAARDLVVDADGDVLRCPTAACGALLPLGYAGVCPVCGGGVDDSEEKSTVTGARTAGSSTSK